MGKVRVRLQLSLPLFTIQPNGNRPIIQQCHLHICPKYAARYREAIASQRILEALDERLRDGWRRGIGEAGAAPPARVCIQCELRDDQRLAADVEQRAVHLALVVLEDTQVGDFVAEGFDLGLAVVMTDAEQDEKSLADLA